MNTATALLVGAFLGIVFSALVAGWIWVELTPGYDHKFSDAEIANIVGEAYGL